MVLFTGKVIESVEKKRGCALRIPGIGSLSGTAIGVRAGLPAPTPLPRPLWPHSPESRQLPRA
ncbi:hypothetical protein D9M72_625710 [compost metagenome]